MQNQMESGACRFQRWVGPGYVPARSGSLPCGRSNCAKIIFHVGGPSGPGKQRFTNCSDSVMRLNATQPVSDEATPAALDCGGRRGC